MKRIVFFIISILPVVGQAQISKTAAQDSINALIKSPLSVTKLKNTLTYVNSATETDPTVSSDVKAISSTNITNWNSAYGLVGNSILTTGAQSASGAKTWTSRGLFTDTYSNGQASFGSSGNGGRVLFNRGSDGALGFAIGFSGSSSTTGYITSSAAMYMTAATSSVVESSGASGTVSLEANHSSAYLNFRSGNAQVGRWFTTGNLNIGGTTDTQAPVQITKSVSASSGIARGLNLIPAFTATANSDQLYALDISSTASTGAFTGVGHWSIRHSQAIVPSGDNTIQLGTSSARYGIVYALSLNSGASNLSLRNSTVIGATMFSDGKLAVQNGGTYTNTGEQFKVTGVTKLDGNVSTTGTIELTPSSGIIYMKSPNGTRYALTVSDIGVLTVTAAP